MAPVSGKLMVHVNVDGVSEDLFYNALEDGRLSAIREAFAGGLRTRGTVTIMPSTTVPAQTSIMTGCWPRKHGIHSFRVIRRCGDPPSFFNFEDIDNAVGYYGYQLFGWPDGLLPHVSEEGTLDARIHPAATTIYQDAAQHGLESNVAFHMVMKGAKRRVLPTRGTFIKYALAHEGVGSWHSYDQDMVEFSIADLEKNGLADINMYYFAGVDASGHYVGGNTEQERFLINSIEPMWADLFNTIQKRAAGRDILFVLSSDHGHNDYIHDDAHAVGTKKLYKLFRSYGYKVLDEFEKNCEDMSPFDLVICSGLGQLFNYVRKKGGSWCQPPDLESDVLPVARRFVDAQGVFGHYLHHLLVKDRGAGAYKVAQLSRNQWTLVDIETFYGDKTDLFPGAVERLQGLYYSDSPDIIVLPNDINGFCFSDHPHYSGHGSLYEQCSRVPALMSGPGMSATEVAGARVIDLMPTAARWMGFDMPNADGRVLMQPAEAAVT